MIDEHRLRAELFGSIFSLMPRKSPAKQKRLPPLTEKERRERFLEEARKAEASNDPKDFDEAFKRITQTKKPESN